MDEEPVLEETQEPEEVLDMTPVWRVSVNQDQILKHPDLAVLFTRPYITRTNMIMPNRVVAEFPRHEKNKAVELYYNVMRLRLTVFRNWLD